ncbi:MAG: non-heme iron oxygenase ferredoxin subunit [Sphingomonadaceae bacterium]
MQLLCKTGDVSEDEPFRVELPNGHAVAVYEWEGAYYCTDDLCSHGDASLAEGYIEDGLIVCPFHMGSFCIKTGEARAAPCFEPVKAYAVTQEEDSLFIDL